MIAPCIPAQSCRHGIIFIDNKIEWTTIETDPAGIGESAPSTTWNLETNAGGYIDPDSDDDGIPDAYELAQGLKLLIDDADDDSDNDGMSNRREFWAGTAAGDSNSVFIIGGVTTVLAGALTAEVTFQSVPGRTYDLYAYDTVGGAPTPAGSVTATGGVTTVAVDLTGPVGFLRAEVRSE